MDITKGLTLSALVAVLAASQPAEAIISDSCPKIPVRERYTKTFTVSDDKENLWTIADRVYGFRTIYDPKLRKIRHLPRLIAQANHLPPPYHIHKGQRLIIPHERTEWKYSGVCSVAGEGLRYDFEF